MYGVCEARKLTKIGECRDEAGFLNGPQMTRGPEFASWRVNPSEDQLALECFGDADCSGEHTATFYFPSNNYSCARVGPLTFGTNQTVEFARVEQVCFVLVVLMCVVSVCMCVVCSMFESVCLFDF